MTTENPIFSKIRKLLALADNARNSSEAEAQAAALKVQELLQDHGLSLSQIEAAGGSSDQPEAREKNVEARRAMYVWQQNLMATLAANNFCMHRVRYRTVTWTDGKNYNSKWHQMVGRKLNMDVTLSTYDYLVSAMRRAADEAGYARRTNISDNTHFLEGAVERLTDRLTTMRQEREEASKKDEKARRASGGTGRDLILTDVYGSEEDLNNDAMNNYAAGTTANRRRERAAQEAAREQKEKDLVASGVEKIQAFYMSHGYEETRAKASANRYHKPMNSTPGNRRSTYRARVYTQEDRAQDRKMSSSAYRAGKIAGDNISLNTQVGGSGRKAIK